MLSTNDLMFDNELKEIENMIEDINANYKGERIDIVKEEHIENESDIVVGIDLGTSNSCISVWRNNRLEIIPDEHNNYTIPSIVSFTNCMRYVGIEARNQSELNPLRTYYEIKRLIGRLFNDPDVIMDRELLAYNILEGTDKRILIECDSKKYTPEYLSSVILSKLKLMAENYLKKPIAKAVITVPAYFNDAQREATKLASKIAGLECIRIINEPTASALAYGFIKREKKKSTIMVYDLGGGTLDVAIMKLDIENSIFQVLTSVGNTHLGGSDFDKYIMDYCLKEFKTKNNIYSINSLS
jgi:molecular chaperone DnaK (HSP70)